MIDIFGLDMGLFKTGVEYIRVPGHDNLWLLEQNPAAESNSIFARAAKKGILVQWECTEEPKAGTMPIYNQKVLIDGQEYTRAQGAEKLEKIIGE